MVNIVTPVMVGGGTTDDPAPTPTPTPTVAPIGSQTVSSVPGLDFGQIQIATLVQALAAAIRNDQAKGAALQAAQVTLNDAQNAKILAQMACDASMSAVSDAKSALMNYLASN